MYDDSQSNYTMNRAAYGDVPAAMMAGGHSNYGGGVSAGMHNMMSDIGGMVMPVGYMPPARVNVGFYGQYQQKTGFISSAMGTVGLGGHGRSQMAADYNYNVASDFGERAGGGLAGVGSTLASMGIGSMMGKVLGGGIVGGLGGVMIGAAAASTVMDAVGQRREISNYLESSSYRYATTGSGLGDHGRSGFGSQARGQVTEMIRGMDIKDPFMSTEDLTMVLQQGTQKGMFAGSGGMDDFKKKFKELVDTVKVTTRTLNQSLEEAMTTIKELKSVGIDPSAAKSVVGSADTLGRMAGRTGAEMLNIGLQGAEFFRGTGVTMGIGAQATMMNLAQVRAGRDAGQISTETIAQAGGEEALAMRMNASGLGFAQSQMGRGFGAAFLGGGGAANFNQGAFMQQMFGGGQGLAGLAQTAAGNLSSPAALIAYQANQEKFMSEAGKTFGGQGLQMMQMGVGMAQAQFLSNATGAKFEDSFRLSMKQNGVSVPEIDTMIGNARGAKQIKASADKAAEIAYGRNLSEESYRSNDYVQMGAKVRDWGKSVVDVVAAPISNAIESVKNSLINFKEETVEGIHRGSSDGINLTRVIPGGNVSTTGVRSIARTMGNSLFGGNTAGTSLAKALTPEMAEAFGIKKHHINSGSKLGSNETIISGSDEYGEAVDLEDATKRTQNWRYSEDDSKRYQESGRLNRVVGGDLGSILSSNKLKNATLDDISRAAYGVRADKLSMDQVMKLEKETKGTYLEKVIKDGRGLSESASNAKDALSSENFILATKSYHAAADSIKKELGNSKLNDDAIQMIASAANTKDPQTRAKLMKGARAEIAKSDDTLDKQHIDDMLDKGVKLTKESVSLASSQATIRASGAAIASDRLASSLVTEATAKGLDWSPDHLNTVRADALGIAKAQSSDSYISAVKKADKDSAIGDGPAGLQARKNAALLSTVQTLKKDDVEVFQKALRNSGLEFSSDELGKVAASFGTGGGKAVEGMILEKIHGEGVPHNATTGASKGGLDGGTSAAEVMKQQMNINNETYTAMRGLAQKLGVKGA